MKIYAMYNPDDFSYSGTIQLNEIQPADGSGLTDVLPSKAMLKALDEGSVKKLLFDQVNKKWRSAKFTDDDFNQAIAAAEAVINAKVRDKLNGPFLYGGAILSMENQKQFEYYDFLLSCVFEMEKFPVKFAASSGTSIEFESLDGVKKFFSSLVRWKKEIKTVGRIVKNGGEINQTQFLPLKDKTMNELTSEAINRLINQAFALWEESKTNAKA